mmetsp:Transcript_39/g.51  ORF Transcript_39/g.51 Transcript_39/m.51 type:complete len:122 (+) Transcript_39:162-527(+)
MCLSTACGRYEKEKHGSVLEAARFELSEESKLHRGRWIQLTPAGHPGVMEAKWAATRFTPFLVIDPVDDPNPKDQDEEEFIFQDRLPAKLVEQKAYEGSMHLPTMQTVFMALKYLRDHEYL